MSDSMLELVNFGLPLEYVLDLDLLSFAAAQDAMARLVSRQKIDSSISARVVQHGDQKLFGKLIKPWKEVAGPDDDSGTGEENTDLAAFLSDFSQGI